MLIDSDSDEGEEKISEKGVKHQRKKSKTYTKSSCKTKKSSLPAKHTNSKKLEPEVSKKKLKKKSEIFVKDTEMDEVDELEGEEYD